MNQAQQAFCCKKKIEILTLPFALFERTMAWCLFCFVFFLSTHLAVARDSSWAGYVATGAKMVLEMMLGNSERGPFENPACKEENGAKARLI